MQLETKLLFILFYFGFWEKSKFQFLYFFLEISQSYPRKPQKNMESKFEQTQAKLFRQDVFLSLKTSMVQIDFENQSFNLMDMFKNIIKGTHKEPIA